MGRLRQAHDLKRPVPNGRTVYEVYTSADRISDGHELEAGINVEVNGEHKATLACRLNTLVQNLEGVDLRPAD